MSSRAEPAAPRPAVEVEDLTHDFGAARALDGTTFTVGRGEIFGLLGPNGAGKTTAMRILLTLLRPMAGRARVAGMDVTADPVAVRRMVGWVPQDRAVDPLMTAQENLRFAAGLYHLSAAAGRRRAAELLTLVELDDHADRLVRDFSGGMRRRLELAMGLVHIPTVLFLDEPTLGLDITSRRRLWRHVQQIRRAGTTILLTTHYLDEADALCDRVAIIHQGRVRAIDAPAELKRRYGRTTLHVQVDDPDPTLLQRLRRHPQVRRARTTGSVTGSATGSATAPVIELEVGDLVPVTEAALTECRALGITPRDLWTQRASLDDVFLALTGDALLAESPADETDEVVSA